MHRVSSKNGLELPFFCPDCNEVNPNNMLLLLERAFRWRGCLKRKVMVLHLLLAVMEEFRSQHFSLNCCLSVNLFLSGWSGWVKWKFWLCGERADDGSGGSDYQSSCTYALKWWLVEKGGLLHTKGLLCLLIWDTQPGQTQFLNRLPAGHLRPQLLYHIERGKLELPALEHVSKAFDFDPGGLSLTDRDWAPSTAAPLPIACMELLLMQWYRLSCFCPNCSSPLKQLWNVMGWNHFRRNYFIPIFLSQCCDKHWSSSRLSVGYSLGPSFQICFLLYFLVSCFVSMVTPQPNSSYNTVRCMNNAVIEEHPQLCVFAHHVFY